MNVFFSISEGAINDDPPPTGLIVLFDMKGVKILQFFYLFFFIDK